jgi:hypothetical protein
MACSASTLHPTFLQPSSRRFGAALDVGLLEAAERAKTHPQVALLFRQH